MRCANCNCEIGNLTQCPYCGYRNRYVYRAQEAAGEYGTVGQYSRQTQPPPTMRQIQYAPRVNAQPVQRVQSAPTRVANPPRKRQQNRERDSGTIEMLLRMILLMQCLIAVLITIQLVITSLGASF